MMDATITYSWFDLGHTEGEVDARRCSGDWLPPRRHAPSDAVPVPSVVVELFLAEVVGTE